MSGVGRLSLGLETVEFAAEQRHDRAGPLHDPHPPGRQGEDEVGVEALPRHGVVARPEAWFSVRTSLGTDAVAMASTKRAPARMIPLCSASGPTMKPETSCTNRIGVPCRFMVSMKKAAFSADSV